MTADKLLKCIAAMVRKRNGCDLSATNYRPKFTVPTRYGPLEIIPFHDANSPWIALRFTEYSTGKVYDTIGWADFNGYSGKWNINPSQDGANRNEQGRRRLREHCLTELERRLNLVCPDALTQSQKEQAVQLCERLGA